MVRCCVGLQTLQVIVLTTFWLVLIGVSSYVTNRVAKEDDDPKGNMTSIERAETLDAWIEIAMAITYVVANVVLFFPAWMKQRRDVQLLTKDDPGDEKPPPRTEAIELYQGDDSTTVINGSPISRPTVHKGAKYFTWKLLKAKNQHK